MLAQGKVGEAQKRTQAREEPVQGETERPFCSRHGIIRVLRYLKRVFYLSFTKVESERCSDLLKVTEGVEELTQACLTV